MKGMESSSDVTQNAFADGAAWMGGHYMPIGDAKISVLDWGLTHSDITYDVAHVWDGAFFRLDDYLDRFFDSMEKVQLSVPQSRDDMRDILHGIVSRSGLRESYVSLVASRGVPMVPGSRDPRDCENHFYAWCVPFVWVFTQEVLARGAKLAVPDFVTRIPSDSVDPSAKNYHWGDFTQGLIHAKETGFDNALLCDSDGNVTEGPGFNVFMVKGDAVITPDHGMLEGITRRTALELSAKLGLRCEERPVSLDEYLEADEVFATTTGGGIMPIVQVGERIFSNGLQGTVTAQLSEAYWALHDDETLSERVTYSDFG